MAVTIGAPPLAGFDRPIDLLMDCHRRIERFLDILVRVAERACETPELDEEYRRALRTSLEYFRAAAPRHTEDEESSLFPLLKQKGDPSVRAVMIQLDRLEAEHRRAGALHDQVDPLANRLLSDGRLEVTEARCLLEKLRELRDLYRRHIEAEDQIVFPLARRALSDEQMQQVGREMAARRVTNPGRSTSRCGQRRRAERGEVIPKSG